jgi:hypothetical protein
VTEDEMNAARTPAGGWTRETLAGWGVPWPPPKGWKAALLAGQSMQDAGLRSEEPSPIRPAMSAHELLRIVVLAVVEKGHASDLYEFPDVLAHFGAAGKPTRHEGPIEETSL